jgi:hypothetical protein
MPPLGSGAVKVVVEILTHWKSLGGETATSSGVELRGEGAESKPGL